MVRTVWTMAAGAAGLMLGSAASAAVLYDNGPCNCQAAAYGISQGNYVLDSFTIGASATATGVTFVAWNSPTYSTTTSVDWAIFSGLRVPYGADGQLIASGTSAVTSTFLLNNTSGYAVNTDTFAIPATALASGTYSLALAGAADSLGDTYPNIQWDVNAGPSTAVIRTNFGPFQGYGPSNTFQILGSVAGAVPEPASWALLVAGFGLTGAVARRRERSWGGQTLGSTR